ncbi:MAG TPA: SDR family NAD(P)-dependent oxidoreductase [Polyangia bacterium]|nr:SDR family NAD(P)-dependent oxidoreductase [Polyangia bacterium]
MAKTILVSGYGPGISTAIAEKFGTEGYAVALAARNAERLAAGVKSLQAKGIKAAAFPTDLADPNAARALVGKVREALGPLTALAWTAYDTGAGDLLSAEPAAIRRVLDIATTSLLATVNAALPDMKGQPDAAVLVVNGGFGYADPSVDAAAVQFNSMGLAMANAAKNKLVGMLSLKLKGDGVYVGQAMVLGTIKGTAWDQGNATIEGSTVAAKLWELSRARTEVTVKVG